MSPWELARLGELRDYSMGRLRGPELLALPTSHGRLHSAVYVGRKPQGCVMRPVPAASWFCQRPSLPAGAYLRRVSDILLSALKEKQDTEDKSSRQAPELVDIICKVGAAGAGRASPASCRMVHPAPWGHDCAGKLCPSRPGDMTVLALGSVTGVGCGPTGAGPHRGARVGWHRCAAYQLPVRRISGAW